jgi:hypothetical protein
MSNNALRFAIVFMIFGALGFLFIKTDVYPNLHTYGISVGTNSHYCSAELVNLLPVVSCENAS